MELAWTHTEMMTALTNTTMDSERPQRKKETNEHVEKRYGEEAWTAA